tara:strand:- start:7234 stop:8658 length:1425 start_codon:yes stop_codon:yes gene_type:complete
MQKSELNKLEIEPEIFTWFESRGIEYEALSYAGIVTGATYTGNGINVSFPRYDKNGDILKSRSITVREGKCDEPVTMKGIESFYNDQGLDLAIEEEKPLVICQGEMDSLSLIQAGYAWTIAYIDGDDLLWNNRERLKKCKKVILAGFDNEIGKEFNDIISRQLGIENCQFLVYPEGSRTINDVLVNSGGVKVTETVKDARNYPVVGLYKPNEFPPIPDALKKVHPTTLGREHNHHLKIMLGKFMVVTGIPGHGKSTWTDGLVMNLAKTNNWNVCVCSTEIDNEEYQEESYHRYLNRPFEDVNKDEQQRAIDFYQEHFTFITNNTMKDELELSLEKLLELAKIAIIRDGAKVLLLDPWNEIEHNRKNGENETEYTGRAIRMLKKLAKQFRILVIVVAHPAKPDQKAKEKIPNLYSINGSANWANKADYGVVIYRENMDGVGTKVITSKIKRHGAMGYVGEIDCQFDARTRRFNEA